MNDCAKKLREGVVDKMIELGDMSDQSMNECLNEMAQQKVSWERRKEGAR